MSSNLLGGWLPLIGAAAMSVALVTAFSGADTGARTFTAEIVTDASAYLAIETNTNSPHTNFVTLSSGKIVIAFDGNNVDASGSGMNEESTYSFDAIIKITNKGTQSRDIDIVIEGADSSLCTVALTATETQTTYSADPTALTVAKDANAYLGLKVTLEGSAKTTTDSVACSITVTGA